MLVGCVATCRCRDERNDEGGGQTRCCNGSIYDNKKPSMCSKVGLRAGGMSPVRRIKRSYFCQGLYIIIHSESLDIMNLAPACPKRYMPTCGVSPYQERWSGDLIERVVADIRAIVLSTNDCNIVPQNVRSKLGTNKSLENNKINTQTLHQIPGCKKNSHWRRKKKSKRLH